MLPDDLIIKHWSEIDAGSHGTVRRALIQYGDFEGWLCIKLFTEEYKLAYEQETLAYELFRYRGIHRCVPDTYWKGAFPSSRWDGKPPNSFNIYEPIVYGIVMELFEDFQEMSYSSLDIPTAQTICIALRRIHAARVRHGDVQEQNILLVNENGIRRVVWIDFSCSWIPDRRRLLLEEYDDFLGSLVNGMVFHDIGLSKLRIPMFLQMRFSMRDLFAKQQSVRATRAPQ